MNKKGGIRCEEESAKVGADVKELTLQLLSDIETACFAPQKLQRVSLPRKQ